MKYKYLTLIAVIYTTILLMTMVIENRVIAFGNIEILSGTLLIALTYSISDVITEVYGYRQMRRIIWTSIIALYLAAVLVKIIMFLPADKTNNTSAAYEIILSPFQRDIFTYSIASMVSIFLNIYILTKWSILINGRYFWLRSLGSTAVGEAIFILTWGFLGFSGKFPIQTLLGLMATSYFYKIICNLLSIIPSSIAVMVLKKSENILKDEIRINYTPFAWEV